MPEQKRLFRYFDPRGSDLFSDQKLWFSAAKDFNDIFEVMPRYDRLVAQQVEHSQKLHFAFLDPGIQVDYRTYKECMAPANKQLMAECLETLPEAFQAKFSEHFGIACFCANVSSLLMWGHYAKCHQGFVVEFDPEHPMFSPRDFGRVQYSLQRPFVEDKDHYKILLTKSPEWQYEEEYRLIKPLHELKHGKRRDGAQKPFLPLDLSAVKAVYFGCRAGTPTHTEFRNALATANAKHIDSYVMRLHPTEYRLVPIPLKDWQPAGKGAVEDFRLLWKSLGL